MIDSTYTVPSDPNTMRDTGPLRNAEYTTVDHVDEMLRKKNLKVGSTSSTTRSTVSSAKMNQIISEMKKDNNLRDSMVSRCSHGTSAVHTVRPVKVLERHTVVAANDYTKNISDFVFSPSLTVVSPQKK